MSTLSSAPSVAIEAFDALAPVFDVRFGAWKSVAAQRAAVRKRLMEAFAPGETLLELGGGTGEDALFLAEHGYRVHLTDGSRSMVRLAKGKIRRADAADRVTAECLAIEELWRLPNGVQFDGCFSNFAAFNCVEAGDVPARALARVLAPGSRALFVIFGPFSPGEMLSLLIRGERWRAFRRLSRSGVPARVGGRSFTVSYPTPRAFADRFAPWFTLRSVRGIGVFVPPSAAEPWISSHPRLLALLQALDNIVASPLAILGDHVLVTLERTGISA